MYIYVKVYRFLLKDSYVKSLSLTNRHVWPRQASAFVRSLHATMAGLLMAGERNPTQKIYVKNISIYVLDVFYKLIY